MDPFLNIPITQKSTVTPQWGKGMESPDLPGTYSAECIEGKLTKSSLDILKCGTTFLTIRASDEPTYFKINSMISAYANGTRIAGFNNTIQKLFMFYLSTTEESDAFLECVSAMNDISPFGKLLLDQMSNHILSYIITNATPDNKITKINPIDFLPILTLIIFKKELGDLPDELIQTICLFFFQNLSIEFSESNTNKYYEHLSHQTLLEYRKPRPTINNSVEK